MNTNNELIKSIVYGTAVGDALGVPVEFMPRSYLAENPITDMIGYGTHEQPAGTWSDDTSLLLAIINGVHNGYDLDKIGSNFINWLYNYGFTAHHEVFDVGMQTHSGISNILKGMRPLTSCGSTDEGSQGNGSLMRTLALVPLVQNLDVEDRYRIITEVSSLTHGHFNCFFACFFLVEYALTLIELKGKLNYGVTQLTALILTQEKIRKFCASYYVSDEKLKAFKTILGAIEKLTENDIKSNGYVMSTLEASIWCLITTDSYESAVLKAINLGDDTDTTAAVTGGLAGILYGFESIPENWIDELKNKELLNKICNGTNI